MADEYDSVLLRGNWLIVQELDKYIELLSVESDAATDLLVGHIKIEIDDITSEPYVNVFLDGKPLLQNFMMLKDSLTFDWGRHLRLHGKHKKPIRIEIKQTKAGAGTLYASAFVDGFEVPARR